MSDVTSRNLNPALPLTERNIGAVNITVQNPNLNDVTVRNIVAEDFTNFSEGTILLGKYVVTDRLPVTSGEANLYICEYDDEEYIAKIYNRKDAVKSEIVERLKALDSPHIAKIYDTGEYEGMSVAILPYYRLGSLQGKRFTLKQLKRMIIPGINDALQSLHNIGILHKDLKPANIMMLSNGKDVALIDFGISSVMDSGASMIITKSGWTLAYASPEALRGAYFDESDYYSFGITLYELFCGHTPYENLNAEQIAQISIAQKLPYPENMPQELKDLITGLTYNDLTNRNDLRNPNRRWTYDEVKKWLAGEKQPIPGGVGAPKTKIVASSSSKSFDDFSYKFDGKIYFDLNELISALATKWSEGKKHLTRKFLSGFFTNRDNDLANYCMDAEEEIQKGMNDDLVFWKLLYKLAPNVKEFFWKEKHYPSLQSFGQEMLTKLRRADTSDKNFWDEIFANHLLSQYLELHAQPKEAVQSLETTNRDRRDGLISYYHAAYLLIGKKELQVEDEKFYTAEELAEYMNSLLDDSAEAFENFAYKLTDNDNKLNEEFEAWLIALGKRNELENWKQNLKTA